MTFIYYPANEESCSGHVCSCPDETVIFCRSQMYPISYCSHFGYIRIGMPVIDDIVAQFIRVPVQNAILDFV